MNNDTPSWRLSARSSSTRLLGISKSDLIDEELRRMITPELPKEIEHAFFSGVSGKGLTELKDKIWDILNRDEF